MHPGAINGLLMHLNSFEDKRFPALFLVLTFMAAMLVPQRETLTWQKRAVL